LTAHRRAGHAAVLLTALLLVGTGCDDQVSPPVVAATQSTAAASQTAPKTVRVVKRDILSTVRLEGVVEANPTLPANAPGTGRFTPTADWQAGDAVQSGGRLGVIATPACDEAAAASGACRVRTWSLVAPGDGVLVAALGEAEVVVGATVATIQPPGFHLRLSAPDPTILYRFTNPPLSAKASIVGGPEGFDIVFESTRYVRETSKVDVFASMPDDVAVFEGLKAVAVFVTDRKPDLNVVPRSAVKGDRQQGRVITVDQAGSKKTVDVQLGVSDAEYIEVNGIGQDVDVIQYPLESDFA
jgi:hypothetical protein